ncbi:MULTISPECIES: flagellar hook-basal body complex protein [unclassified Thermotoga]|uniref:flagellar hook-basal body complex protein n=1 Tax=unclassified Thermotoga TaxID=2631113 RepID=UPI000280E796|nr:MULTISPECIES: flagellar hook-basal body complex protein [unclassified Thermotoga]AIY85809.1 flagellar hook-basal body protein [Thermotoga sp. 2812B]EJX26904.1 flagellar hook-basal body protein [Thermotoga sp. EMP]
MMRSLYSGITGLKNFQVAMDVVGNNISNVNTVGFKASRVNFETMIAQMIKAGRPPQGNVGGTNPMQIGLGSQVSSIDKIMTQGSFQNTGVKTDLAIQGDGFFIVSDGSSYYYTRAGAFTLDSNGNLIQTSTGYKVQGWTAVQDPETGERYIDTNRPIGDLVISAGMTMSAKKTSNVRFEGNLNSSVGPEPFYITLVDNNGENHEVRIWFEKTSQDLGSDPFGDNQRYTMKIDTDGDGVENVTGYIVFDKFGNVTDAGIYFYSSLVTAEEDGIIQGTTPLSDGTYDVEVKDSNGNIIYSGQIDVSGGVYKIEDPNIKSGETYAVEFKRVESMSETADATGLSGTVDASAVEPGSYKALIIDSNGQRAADGVDAIVSSDGSFVLTTNLTAGNSYSVVLYKDGWVLTGKQPDANGDISDTVSDPDLYGKTVKAAIVDSQGNVTYQDVSIDSDGNFTVSGLDSNETYTIYFYPSDEYKADNLTAEYAIVGNAPAGFNDGEYSAVVLDSNSNVVYNGAVSIVNGEYKIVDSDFQSGGNYTVILSPLPDIVTGEGVITGTVDTSKVSPGDQNVMVLDSSGNVVFEGTVTVNDDGSFTITDPDIKNGGDYTVVFTSTNAVMNKLFVAPGAELVIPTYGTPRFYEADNPNNFVQTDFTSPHYTTAVQVYDSLGNAYTVYYEFVRLGRTVIDGQEYQNAWIWRAYTDNGEPVEFVDKNGNSAYNGHKYIAGILDFDENGSISLSDLKGLYYDETTGTYRLGDEMKTIQFDTSKEGDGTVKIDADFSNITQFSGDSTVNIPWQDGNPMGVLESFAINEQGEIIGTFSNGLTDVLGQIALAVFNNPSGLSEVGNSLYVVSANSGVPKIGAPGSGGRGVLIPGALEMSNVDLAEEFTKMIVAQRGFQANARVITTADQILNELVNIKR